MSFLANSVQLKAYATHPDHKELMALLGRNVILLPDKVLPNDHWELRVVESLLIQFQGCVNDSGCDYVKMDLGFLLSVGLWLAGLGKLVDHV